MFQFQGCELRQSERKWNLSVVCGVSQDKETTVCWEFARAAQILVLVLRSRRRLRLDFFRVFRVFRGLTVFGYGSAALCPSVV